MAADDEWRLPTKQAGIAADWALWSKMPTAEVLSAVVLSLGIEPLKLSTHLRITEAERRYNRLGPKFRSRYELASANVSKTGPLHPAGSALMVNGRGGATVSLPEFGAWAIGMGWELPERFPRSAPAAKPIAVESPAAEPAPAGDAAVEGPPTLTKPQIVDAFEGIDGPPAPAKPATPDPVTAQDGAVVGAVPGWDLNRLERFPGYRRPLFNYLKIEHVAGKKCPTAHDVLDAWTQTKPLGIARVLADGIDYLDANGNEHPAPLRAIQQAINGMVTKT